MSYKMTIGDFSRISNLSPKALRLYDRQGLLKPIAVDPSTGYRYYAPIQVIESERIRILRSLDMPLEEIRSFLEEKDPAVLRERLGSYRKELEIKVSSMRRNMDFLDKLTEKREEIFLNYAVVVKEVEDQPIISTRIETSISKIGENMGRAFNEVCDHMTKMGLSTDGVGIALYHCQEFDPEHLDVEVAMAVDKLYGSSEKFTFRNLPGGTVASILHCGPYEGIQAAYGALYEWVGEKGYEKTGPDREVYFNCPATVEKPEDLRTEIAIPVRKKD